MNAIIQIVVYHNFCLHIHVHIHLFHFCVCVCVCVCVCARIHTCAHANALYMYMCGYGTCICVLQYITYMQFKYIHVRSYRLLIVSGKTVQLMSIIYYLVLSVHKNCDNVELNALTLFESLLCIRICCAMSAVCVVITFSSVYTLHVHTFSSPDILLQCGRGG